MAKKKKIDFHEYCGKYDIHLSEQQEQAVLRGDGETLLLAVPGSGKTTVIIARTGYLIHCLGIPAKNIITITYSKAAALEMEERYKKKFGNAKAPKFSTIHSLCVNILQYAKKTKGLQIPKLVENTDKMVRRALYEDTKKWPSEMCVKHLERLLTCATNKMYSEAEIDAMKCVELSSEFGKMPFAQFYDLYVEYKRKNRLMDFDDQLKMAYDCLLDHDDVRHYYQTQYPYIGLDESQDTSVLQFEIIRLLANGGKSLFVVGDDDQSIYGFRGAEPANILNFTSSYPEAAVMYMETNYRSNKDIVDAADVFIQENHARFAKKAVAAKTEPGIIETKSFETEHGVYSEVMRRIVAAEAGDRTLAIISRNNYTLLPIVDELSRTGQNVRRRDNFSNIFIHPAISGIIATMTLANEPWNFDAFKESRNALKTYISNKHLDAISEAVKASPLPEQERDVVDIAISCVLEDYVRKALSHAKSILTRISMASPERGIALIMDECGQNLCLDKYSMNENGILRTSIVTAGTLKYIARNYKDLSTYLAAMKQYATSKTDTRGIQSNVTLTTIHSAKGLEFDDVIILDAIEGVMPQDIFGLNTEGDTEEDSRLFYVAVTRAKERVDFLVPRNLYGQPVDPSRYIARLEAETGKPKKKSKSEAKKETPTTDPFNPGTRVKHSVFGEGVVVSVDRDILTIKFDGSGEKRILAAFVQSISA